MNRKKFIESLGGTCNNWQWSWSFINKKKKYVFFGTFEDNKEDELSLIFSTKWKFSYKGHRSKGYKQSLEHLRLIEEEGYHLYVFKMEYSKENKDPQGRGPAKIKRIVPTALPRKILKNGKDIYSTGLHHETFIHEESITLEDDYFEGGKTTVSVNTYERNIEARNKCLEIYGYKCVVCNFDFEETYGKLGKQYIHVHHIYPLHKINKIYKVNPENDLRPVCANCHAMIHRKRKTRSIESLKKIIERAKRT